jgi:hypothetical protein
MRLQVSVAELGAIVSLLVVLICTTSSCREGVRPSANERTVAADPTTRKREDDLRRKERCAIAAERFDRLFATPAGSRSQSATEVSEVFYSPVRNTCICEVSTVGKDRSVMLTLYDCLTREDLGHKYIELGSANSAQLQEDWTRKKDELKGGKR